MLSLQDSAFLWNQKAKRKSIWYFERMQKNIVSYLLWKILTAVVRYRKRFQESNHSRSFCGSQFYNC